MSESELHEYYLALSPELDIGAAEFVEAWNASPEGREIGEARLESPSSTGAAYPILPDLPPDTWVVLSNLAIGAAGGIGANMVSDALYDAIKKLLFGRGKRARVKVVKPKDGRPPILVAEPDEEESDEE